MKIKKFNESKKELDTEYLSLVFADFIDNGAEIEIDEVKSKKYWQIYLDEPQLNLKFKSIDEYTNNINEIYEFSKDLESCFKKLDDDNMNYEMVCEEIVDEEGNNIFDRGIDRDFNFPQKLKRIIIITFSE